MGETGAQWETRSHGYLVAEVGFQLGSLHPPPTPGSPGGCCVFSREPWASPASPSPAWTRERSEPGAFSPHLPASEESVWAGGQHSASELAACRVVGRAAVRVLTLAHLCKRGPSAPVENFGAGERRARGPFHSHEERSCLIPPRRPSPGRGQDDTALQ